MENQEKSRVDQLEEQAGKAIEQAKDLSKFSIDSAKQTIKLFGEAGGNTFTLDEQINKIEEDLLYKTLGLDDRARNLGRPKKKQDKEVA